jgi:phosphatidylinositol alpha-mannosyltransferase
LRIVLACPYAWDDPGGVQVHVRELAERLIGRKHDVIVLAPVRRHAREPWVRAVGRPLDVPYNASNAPIDPRPWSRARVRTELRGFGPDVIHVHEPLTPSTSMWTTLEAGSTPVVATFHSGASRSWLFDATAPLLRRVAGRLAIRIAVSEAAASFARRRLGGAYEIVPNAVDTARFEAAAPADLGPGTKLVFVGRLDERKGFPTALGAFASLAEERPGIRLIVVGDGPDRAAVATLSASLRECVTLLGAIPNADLPPYLAACDVYLGPAVRGESFGVVLVEAMAAGLPVVASDIAGYTEVVRAGVEGLLVRPRDPAAMAAAVTRVLDEPGLADRLIEAGHARARSFDWAVVVVRIEEIYRRTIEDAPASIR